MGPDLGTRLGLLAAAMAIEAIAGYPGALYRAAGHPVTWFGALIGWLDRALNRDGPEPSSTPHPTPLPKGEGTRAATTDNPSSPPLWGEGQGEGWGRVQFLRQRLAGVMALLVLLTTTIAVAISLQCALAASWPGLFLLGLLVSALLATRSLDTHVGAVAAALVTGGLDAGRLAVSQIVGRDPEALDEAGVCRAAIESLAENFSDGVIAPALWFAVAGLPGVSVVRPPVNLRADGAVVALELATRAHDYLAAHPCVLVVLLGGDTADAFLGERAVRIHGSVGVGMAYGTVEVDGRSVRVVSKPGGFGATNALVDLLVGRSGR